MFQFPMWPGERHNYLERHDFYVAQAKARLFSQFSDMSGEADRYASEQFAHLGSVPSYGDDVDLPSLAEEALERAVAFYGLLSDLRTQTVLSILAGLYHQWEKDLRRFIERELRCRIGNSEAQKRAWKIGTPFEVLREFGWDCQSHTFFSRIDACHLIVNVYKHGKGPSFDRLREKYPQYLDDPLGSTNDIPFIEGTLDYEWLDLTEEQFDEIAAGFRQFWVEFPEQQRLVRQDKEDTSVA
jgi:hypothetical protein